MALRYNHSHGCQTCGAHPDNPRNKTQKLFGCRNCKSFSCSRHLGKSRTCPRCQSKRIYIAVRFQAQNMKNKGGTGEIPKKGLFGGGGGGGGSAAPSDRGKKAANVATEIAKGLGSGVAEAIRILSEKDHKAQVGRPEDGITTEELHNNTVMGKQGDNLQDMLNASPDIGLVEDADPLFRLTVLAENTLDAEAFLATPNKKPRYTADSYLFAPSLYEAEKISEELRRYNDEHEQKMLCVLALYVDPNQPEVGTRFSQLLADNSYLFGSIAVNPQLAHKIDLEAVDEHLSDLLNSQEKIIALGAAGYDLHFNPRTEAEQGALLALHAEIATDFELPLFVQQKEGEAQLKKFIEELDSAQSVILTQPMWPLPEREDMRQLITVDISDEETARKYGLIAQKLKKSHVLLGSGSRLSLVKNEKNQRNQSAFTLNTLKTFCERMKYKQIYSVQHTLNGNFLKTFHPDL